MSVEVINEPQPPPKRGSLVCGCHILLVEEKTGKTVNEVKTPGFFENEKRLREERKY